MDDEESVFEAAIEEARVNVDRQADTVRALKDEQKARKKAKEDTADIDAKVLEGVQELKQAKALVEEKEKAMEQATGIPRNKEAFRETVARALEGRMFYMPSFKIYGGVAGLYDYGPPGCALKANVTQFWRQHFVMAEGMLEVECPAVTPACVLKASGHVDRFEDFMVTDVESGEPMRADHLLEDALEKLIDDRATPADVRAQAKQHLATVGEMKLEELAAMLAHYKCTSPATGNALSAPFPFNLMFKTNIGPRSNATGYLRPETAQGIFVNFRDLLYYNGGRLPFAVAQIGQSFRNEINPCQGLLRVREFTQAEIEHFVSPKDKSHPRFKDIADLAPLMYSQELQTGDAKRPLPMALSKAVADGIVANETLAYFIGRTYLFMTAIGIAPKRLRFRQHLKQEMAHYAADCWDAEVHTSYGWIECAGLADRAAFDLSAHATASKVELVAHERFDEARTETVVEVVPDMKVVGRELKKAGKAVSEHLKALSSADALALQAELESAGSSSVTVDGETFSISKEMVAIQEVTRKLHGCNYVPSVIEPSFGIGRILYCLFEHTFYQRRDDEQKTVFRFSPLVAPVKTTVFPLLQKPALNALALDISAALRKAGLSNIVDTSGTTIGRRYARTDEIGVPFAVTVDPASLEDNTVTVRERDSTAQVRVPVSEVTAVLKSLCEVDQTWEEVCKKYPAQAVAAAE